MYLHIHTDIQTYLQQNKKEIHMPITILISMTGHMVVAGIYNYLLFHYPFSTPFAFKGKPFSTSAVSVSLPGGVTQTSFLKDLDH